MPEPLAASDLATKLAGRRLAREVRVLAETTSTNDVTADFARAGAAEGLLIFAEQQTRGRGRMGRVWESSRGQGLWFSLLLRPSLPMAEWSRLTIWAAVAVAEALQDFVPCAALIKWPNDIYLNGRKAVGILTESFVERNGFAVLGVGVNVNQPAFAPPLDGTATSLRIAAGAELDRAAVAVAIVRRLDESYAQVGPDFPGLLARAEERNFLRDRAVSFSCGSDTVSGVVVGMDESGALLVNAVDGRTHRAVSGEVTLLEW